MIELEKLKEKVHTLERFKRDVIIGVVIVGACMVAFLGYQSFVAIPKAVEDSFKQKALDTAKEKANEHLDEILGLLNTAKKHEKAAFKASKLSEDYSSSAEQNQMSTRREYEEAKSSKAEFRLYLEKLTKATIEHVVQASSDEAERLTKDARAMLSRLSTIEGDAKNSPLTIENGCSSPIQIAIWYTAAYGVTRGGKWWTIEPNESSGLSVTGVGTVALGSPIIYYYAKTTDESDLVWNGDEKISIKGEYLDMKKTELTKENGKYKLNLTCQS